jgi:DNA-binding CsgD family transcriptional regulator
MGVSDPMDMNGWFANLLPEDRERVRRANRQALKSRRFDEVMRVRLPDSGEVRWLHAVATAVAEENGEPEYVNGILIDITEQKRVEEALSDRERKLVAESEKLREINVALRVLLKKRAEDRVELEEKVLANVTELIQPHLEKARSRVSDPRARVHLDIAEENLEQISSSFARKLTSRSFRLTPAEIQVAHLVRQGDNTRKIARHLNISPKTVEVHRLNIRKKLRIAGQRVNLRTFLLNLD